MFIVVVGAFACSEEAKAPLSVSGPTTEFLVNEPRTQAACPTPQDYCATHHAGSIATASCEYGACFEMQSGREVRVVAADERGIYPRTWFIWPDKDSAITPGFTSCILTEQGNKIRADIQDGFYVCRIELHNYSSGTIYHEHFASNPFSPCMGWLECKQ
jgi:hypothetical protein